jgi:hypothetical protein
MTRVLDAMIEANDVWIELCGVDHGGGTISSIWRLALVQGLKIISIPWWSISRTSSGRALSCFLFRPLYIL